MFQLKDNFRVSGVLCYLPFIKHRATSDKNPLSEHRRGNITTARCLCKRTVLWAGSEMIGLMRRFTKLPGCPTTSQQSEMRQTIRSLGAVVKTRLWEYCAERMEHLWEMLEHECMAACGDILNMARGFKKIVAGILY